MKPSDEDLRKAITATEEELKSLVHHPSSEVISRVILNRNLTEDLALVIANRRNVLSEVIETLYHSGKWKVHYRIVQALSKNPRTPQKIALALLKSLRIIDIADLTRNKQVPIGVRTKAELYINEKILTMPLGIKITIARRASRNVLMRLIEDGMREVVDVCLQSHYITEGDICNIVRMRKIAGHVIRQIAEHPKWSVRYDVQRALIRNNNTPLAHVVKYLENIKTMDLKELQRDTEVPASTKSFIHREVLDRGAIEIEATH
jgi:hypothetical protein